MVRGIRTMPQFKTSPFPYDGNVPATGKPFFDVVLDDRVGRQSLRGTQTFWADETYADQRVLVDIPAGFAIGQPGVMVVFFHGNGATLERDVVSRQKIPGQVAWAGLNSVLLAPQFAVDAGDSSAGQFWLQGAFSAFLDEAAATLSRLTGARSSARYFRQLPLVLVGYSGGYHPIAYTLHHAAHERIAGVLLLDALYGDLDKFAAWVQSRDAGFFVSSWTKSSADGNGELARLLQQRHAVIRDALPAVLRPRDIVFLPAHPLATHADFATRGWVDFPIADVLSRLGLPPRRGPT